MEEHIAQKKKNASYRTKWHNNGYKLSENVRLIRSPSLIENKT